jgi:hypothetical protein
MAATTAQLLARAGSFVYCGSGWFCSTGYSSEMVYRRIAAEFVRVEFRHLDAGGRGIGPIIVQRRNGPAKLAFPD